jgi:hypothetical protein
MLESIAALHARIIADLAKADELGLTDVGIQLDQARIHLEEELARRRVLGVTEDSATTD